MSHIHCPYIWSNLKFPFKLWIISIKVYPYAFNLWTIDSLAKCVVRTSWSQVFQTLQWVLFLKSFSLEKYSPLIPGNKEKIKNAKPPPILCDLNLPGSEDVSRICVQEKGYGLRTPGFSTSAFHTFPPINLKKIHCTLQTTTVSQSYSHYILSKIKWSTHH